MSLSIRSVRRFGILRSLAASVVALAACGDGKPEPTGTSGPTFATPAAAAEACAASLRRPLREAFEPAPCVQAIAAPACRDAVAKAIAEKASRAHVVPAFMACREAYCGHKVKSDDLCAGPGPTRPGEARGRLSELLAAAIAADHADVEGKLHAAGLFLEKAVLATTPLRFTVRTDPDVVISGLGDDLRMTRPPTAESLAQLVDRLEAREGDPALADVLIDTPGTSAAGPVMDVLKALQAAGFNHVVLCTPAGNCR